MNGAPVVNQALSRSRVQHDAVAIGILDQTLVSADFPNELSLEGIDVHAHFIGHGLDLFWIYPNVAGGSATAITALGALKLQSVAVPRRFLFPAAFVFLRILCVFFFGHSQSRDQVSWRGRIDGKPSKQLSLAADDCARSVVA